MVISHFLVAAGTRSPAIQWLVYLPLAFVLGVAFTPFQAG